MNKLNLCGKDDFCSFSFVCMSVVSLPIAESVAIKHIKGFFCQKNKQLLKNQLFSFEMLKERGGLNKPIQFKKRKN